MSSSTTTRELVQRGPLLLLLPAPVAADQRVRARAARREHRADRDQRAASTPASPPPSLQLDGAEPPTLLRRAPVHEVVELGLRVAGALDRRRPGSRTACPAQHGAVGARRRSGRRGGPRRGRSRRSRCAGSGRGSGSGSRPGGPPRRPACRRPRSCRRGRRRPPRRAGRRRPGRRRPGSRAGPRRPSRGRWPRARPARRRTAPPGPPEPPRRAASRGGGRDDVDPVRLSYLRSYLDRRENGRSGRWGGGILGLRLPPTASDGADGGVTPLGYGSPGLLGASV